MSSDYEDLPHYSTIYAEFLEDDQSGSEGIRPEELVDQLGISKLEVFEVVSAMLEEGVVELDSDDHDVYRLNDQHRSYGANQDRGFDL